MTVNLHQIAAQYIASGYSVFPVRADGSKAPAADVLPSHKWQEFQTRQATPDELHAWYGNGAVRGFALVHGAISGNLETIDFDKPGAFEEFGELVTDHGRADLLDRLIHVETPSGGHHLTYRCEEPAEGNQKLARYHAPIPETEVGGKIVNGVYGQTKAKIETRGTGGYTIAPGSPAGCHETGKLYRKVSGDYDNPPVLTAEERAFLLSMARACSEIVEETRYRPMQGEPQPRQQDGDRLRPGDVFAASPKGQQIAFDLLLKAGWRVVGRFGDGVRLCRPGKVHGVSATLGYKAPGVFHVFTSSAAPFENDRAYDAYQIFALLECNGDFKEAARRLGVEYGEPASPRADRRREARQANAEASPEPPIPQLDPIPPYPEGGYHTTDLGNAERLIHRHGHQLRFNKAFGWSVWDGKRWQEDESGEIYRLVKEVVRFIHEEAADAYRQVGALESKKESALREMAGMPPGETTGGAKAALDARLKSLDEQVVKATARAKELIVWAFKSEAASRIEAAVSLAQKIDANIYADPDSFDADPLLLNVQNGIVDLRTGTLMPHRPEAMCSRICAVNFNAVAKAPLWEQCLARWQPDPDTRSFLARAAGYSLTGHTGEETAFLLYGSGRNGKSKFTGALEYIMGEYAGRSPIEIFMQGKMSGDGNGPTPDKADLVGKRLVIASEIMQARRFNESFIKDVTGGDKITAAKKFRDPFTFKPVLKLWFYGNHKPEINGTDDGIKARLPLIPFTVTIPVEERDQDLDAKLQAEGEGILAWAVRGCIAWQKQRLSPTDAVVTATNAYHADMDVLAGFFKACCVFEVLGGEKQLWTPTSELRAALTEWARGEGVGEKALPKPNDFGDRLRREGCADNGGKPRKHNGKAARCWSNVRLRTDEDPEDVSEKANTHEGKGKQVTPVTPGYTEIDLLLNEENDFPMGKDTENSVTGVTGVTFSEQDEDAPEEF